MVLSYDNKSADLSSVPLLLASVANLGEGGSVWVNQIEPNRQSPGQPWTLRFTLILSYDNTTKPLQRFNGLVVLLYDNIRISACTDQTVHLFLPFLAVHQCSNIYYHSP